MNLQREKLLLTKRKISIEIVSYVYCMQCIQHIFDRSTWSLHMKDNLHKSKINILSSNKIRNCIWSINLTSARKREKTVRQRMQTWNTTESDSALCCKDVQKSKHQDSESRNVHKFAACSFEHAARQDHVTQLSQQSYAENQINMQTDTCSSDECQSHYFSLFHH